MTRPIPSAGPILPEDVALLEAGDVLRFTRPDDVIDVGQTVSFVEPDHLSGDFIIVDWSDNDGTNSVGGWNPDAFAFIGRPDPEGWMPWSGGENPVPGQMVNVRQVLGQGNTTPMLSDHFGWSFSGLSEDIIAFRLASAEPDRAEGGETPNARLGLAEDALREAVSTAMQDAWEEICNDSGCHPLDIDQLGRKRLQFTPRHWADLTALRLQGLLPPTPAVEGEGRDVSGETVMGMRVAGYRWKTPVLDTFSWSYASHWSTPGEHVEAERLFTETDVRRILSLPSQEQAGTVEVARNQHPRPEAGSSDQAARVLASQERPE